MAVTLPLLLLVELPFILSPVLATLLAVVIRTGDLIGTVLVTDLTVEVVAEGVAEIDELMAVLPLAEVDVDGDDVIVLGFTDEVDTFVAEVLGSDLAAVKDFVLLLMVFIISLYQNE